MSSQGQPKQQHCNSNSRMNVAAPGAGRSYFRPPRSSATSAAGRFRAAMPPAVAAARARRAFATFWLASPTLKAPSPFASCSSSLSGTSSMADAAGIAGAGSWGCGIPGGAG
eukprot:15471359-Alexandrium_andersonii.AAC.1